MTSAAEFELRARLPDDGEELRERLADGDWELRFRGRMSDRWLDTPDGTLENRGEVLRVRRYRGPVGEDRTLVAWKGPAREEEGFKRREELETTISDPGIVLGIFERIGYRPTMALDRDIEVYHGGGVTVRIERFPHMDTLAEIEGEPKAVEARLSPLGLAREAWTPWPLSRFVSRFEERTGEEARLSRTGSLSPADGAEDA